MEDINCRHGSSLDLALVIRSRREESLSTECRLKAGTPVICSESFSRKCSPRQAASPEASKQHPLAVLAAHVESATSA